MRGARSARRIGVLAPFVGTLSSLVLVAVPVARAAPTRLQLRVERSTLRVGETTGVTIGFLDRDFRPVANDRDRTVILAVRGAGSGGGHGDISPGRVTVPAGTASFSDARFTARAPGTVTIRTESDGLAPAEGFVRIVNASASVLSRILVPAVHADGPAFEVLASRSRPVANGVSTGSFYVQLDESLPAGQSLRVRITTEPPVTLRLGDQPVGIVEIGAGRDKSEPISVLSVEAGKVRIRAQALPAGPTSEAEIEFDAPQPARVLIELSGGSEQVIASNRRVLPLEVRVGDKDRIPIERLGTQHLIELSPETSHLTFGIRFEPTLLSLQPGHPGRQSILRLSGFPLSDEIRLLARDRDDERDLAPGELTVKVVAAGFTILVLAGMGGVFGGLARHVYQGSPAQIRPRRLRGRLEPGLLGNGLFGVVFGLVMFLGVNLLVLAPTGLSDTGSANMAFLLGVLGGFGGILVLQRLLDRVLPGGTAGAPAAGKAAA